MGMIRFLVALHPRKWRQRFGDEYAALLEDTRLTPGAIGDVVVNAARLRAAGHRRLALVVAGLLWSAALEYLSVRAGLTANIAWAPTTPARAVALAATIGPWLVLAGRAVLARRRPEASAR